MSLKLQKSNDNQVATTKNLQTMATVSCLFAKPVELRRKNFQTGERLAPSLNMALPFHAIHILLGYYNVYMLHKILDSWFERHLFVMGIAFGFILLVLYKNGHQLAAVVFVTISFLLAMMVWLFSGYHYHPWYFAVPPAIIFGVHVFTET